MTKEINGVTPTKLRIMLESKEDIIDLNKLSDDELKLALYDSNFYLENMKNEVIALSEERVNAFLKNNNDYFESIGLDTLSENATWLASQFYENLNYDISIREIMDIVEQKK